MTTLLSLKKFLLENKSPKQTVVKNVFWLSATQVSRILRIVIVIYAARVLGTSQYGLFSYVIGVMGIFSFFSDIGTGELLTRDIAKHKEKESEYFATSFWIRMFLICTTIVIVLMVGPLISKYEAAKPLILLAIFFIFFNDGRELMLSYLRGSEKMEFEALIITVLNLSMVLAGLIILFYWPTAKSLLLVYILSGAAAFLVSIIVCKKVFRGVFRNFRKDILIEILKNGWPIAVAGISSLIIINFDILMLGWWRTSAEIGLYSAGQRIIQVLYTIPAIISTAAYPTISAIIKNNDHRKERAFNEKSLSTIFLYSMPAALGGIILSRPIFELLYGQAYIGGVETFRLLILSILFIFPSMIISNLIVAHNQQKELIKFLLFTCLINIVLNIIFIPPFGIYGAAGAALITQAANYGITWYKIRKITYFETVPHLKKIILCSAIMGLFSFVLNKFGIFVIVNIILSAGLYLALIILLKERMIFELVDIFKSIKNQRPEDTSVTIGSNM